MPLENIKEKKKISHHTKYYQKTSKLFGINNSSEFFSIFFFCLLKYVRVWEKNLYKLKSYGYVYKKDHK